MGRITRRAQLGHALTTTQSQTSALQRTIQLLPWNYSNIVAYAGSTYTPADADAGNFIMFSADVTVDLVLDSAYSDPPPLAPASGKMILLAVGSTSLNASAAGGVTLLVASGVLPASHAQVLRLIKTGANAYWLF